MLTRGTGLLADRYALEGVIGRGGMADVYRATDTVLEREVAVKVLRTHAVTEHDRARFRDEAKLLGSLQHPGLVGVLDAGLSDDDMPYLVMELVDGDSLAHLVQGSKVPGHRVARVGADLADVLTYVHERDIVHRDIKPSNILIGRDGVVRLADFGIARMLGDVSGHTATGTTIGTAAYIAPEQVRGEPVTPAGDIYSLGLVLLEALTGRRAYTGGPMEAALARLHTAPLIPTSLPTGWPGLLARMTDVAPQSRPSAREVAYALRHLEDDPVAGPDRRLGDSAATGAMSVPVDADPEPRDDSHDDTGGRRPRGGWVVAALVVVVLAAGAFVVGTSSRGSSATHDDLPAGVSAELRQPLQDLHDAVRR
jgi:serine/threonine protein kinase